MAQEKEVKEKPKRTRKTQKSAKEKPYVEQINELLFVHNKEDPKAGVQAVSEIDGEGKVRTGSCRRKERKLLSEIREKLQYPRKLHQELLEPAQGTYTFQAHTNDHP